MSLQEMPEDILKSIYDLVDSEYNVIKKHKDAVMKKITENNLVISPNIVYAEDNDSEFIDYIIKVYIENMTQKEKNAVICEYGFNKGLRIFYDFHRLCLGDSSSDICMYFELHDYTIDDSIIQLIINNEIGFHTCWRNGSSE